MVTARRWLGVFALTTVIVVVMGGLFVVGLALVPKPYDGCPSEEWALEVESALTALVPAGSGQVGTSTSDCDDNRGVTVSYEPRGPVNAALASTTPAATRQGWAERTADPEGGCFERTIRDLPTSMLVYVDDDDGVTLSGAQELCR